MAKIFNGTPHDINVIVGAKFSPEIRKHTGGEVVATIPSDGVLNARIETVETTPVDGIPVFERDIVGFDPLPEGFDIYIVSMLYATAHGQNGKIYTVADPVMSNDGKTFRGCRGIAKF